MVVIVTFVVCLESETRSLGFAVAWRGSISQALACGFPLFNPLRWAETKTHVIITCRKWQGWYRGEAALSNLFQHSSPAQEQHQIEAPFPRGAHFGSVRGSGGTHLRRRPLAEPKLITIWTGDSRRAVPTSVTFPQVRRQDDELMPR